jgi:hypothetical protein
VVTGVERGEPSGQFGRSVSVDNLLPGAETKKASTGVLAFRFWLLDLGSNQGPTD